MSDAWTVVLTVSLVTVVFKAAGPVLLGRRRLTGGPLRVIGLVAPVLLTALVVVQTLGGDRELVLDERIAGVGVAGIALWRGVGLVPGMAIAGVVTAMLRAASLWLA